MRIVIDTNLWISALISASLRQRLETLIGDERIHILASSELMTELEQVAMRPNLQKYIKQEHVIHFLDILTRRLDFVVTSSVVQICRDPNDDFLLALCLDGNANYLLTGDKDLLVLNPFESTKILSLTEFEDILA